MSGADIVQAFRSLARRTRISLMVIGAALLVGAFLVAVGEYVRATWSAEAQDLRRELNNVQGMTRSLRADH